MTTSEPARDIIPDQLIAAVCERLAAGKQVRRTLPGGGRLHIDRPLPFLCVYRQPPEQRDQGTADFLKGEASFLIAPGAPRLKPSLAKLVECVGKLMSARFGGFLILELWSEPDRHTVEAAELDSLRPSELRPAFRIAARGRDVPRRTITKLERNLAKIAYLKQAAEVEVDEGASGHPSGLPALLTTAKAKQLGCQFIGLAIRPIYREPETGNVFPEVLRALRRGLGRAMKQAFYTFALTRTNVKPQHYYALGRRAMVKSVWDIDRRLSEVSDSFDFLLQVTPVNAEAAWQEFRRTRFSSTPRFYYRPLAVEPAELKRRLYEIPIDRIEDPTLGHLFRERQDELDRKITMLMDIGTPRFLLGSLQVYGDVGAPLLDLANKLLRSVPERTRDDFIGGQLDAHAFAERARAEIEYYRSQYAGFSATAEVREDMFAGLLCSEGKLLIGRRAEIPASRVEALLQHEVGTHLLTYYNGLAAPFQLLHSGFAGYDGLQEGLAVLTEHLVGGLNRPRMRVLAGRVVAAASLIGGADFIETFRLLDRELGFSQRTAYTMTMRAYRGGGLTKDVVYLRGLDQILAYLRDGGELEPLFVGKIAIDHIPLMRELQLRQVLRPPPLRPKYMDKPEVHQSLAALRQNGSVLGLIA